MSYRLALVFAGILLAGAAPAADGLQAPDASAWPVWQARIHLGFETSAGGRAGTLRQAALLGDYYLHRQGDGDASARWRGGFRATSGIVVGRIGAWTNPSALGQGGSTPWLDMSAELPDAGAEAWPYIGFGYSGLAPRGGWGFSADFGLALRQPGAAPDLGRALLGLRGWEDTLRRVDLMPMVQLGVRYSF
jgi:hypothetical protein